MSLAPDLSSTRSTNHRRARHSATLSAKGPAHHPAGGALRGAVKTTRWGPIGSTLRRTGKWAIGMADGLSMSGTPRRCTTRPALNVKRARKASRRPTCKRALCGGTIGERPIGETPLARRTVTVKTMLGATGSIVSKGWRAIAPALGPTIARAGCAPAARASAETARAAPV